ncbi:MAG: aspartate aminotransferase family protein [Bacteroidota bacterium]
MKRSPEWLTAAEDVLIRYCVEFSDVLVDKSEGSYFYTQQGKKVLDFTSGQMCSIFGHNHPDIVEALKAGADSSIHLLSTILSPPVIELAYALNDLLPEQLSRSMFLSTGSESNEIAIRMAKLYTDGFEVIGLSGSWHGMTAGAQSSTYSLTRKNYGPAMPGSYMIAAPNSYRCPIKHCKNKCDNTCLQVGISMVDNQSVNKYAACIVEPILSAAGVIELTPDYLTELSKLCKERGLVLIYDEAQTGLGRLGTNFGFEHSQVTPDILTLSKTLGGGLPISSVTVSRELEEDCFEKGFICVTSHVSDPLPARVGLTMLSILVERDMKSKAKVMGEYLKAQLLLLKDRFECIGDVRGRGLLLGMEIVKSRMTKEPDSDLGAAISERCLRNGLSMNIVRIKGYASVFRIAPPLTVSREEIDLGVSILDKSIQECLDELST